MKNVLSNNAFGILGILPDTSQKEISKRGKELLKLLKFGDDLTYPYDFDIYASKRTENTINEAINELSSIKTHILHSFFRIYPVSETEKKKIDSLLNIESIKDKVDIITTNTSIKGRNKLIILLILLIESSKKTEIKCIMKAILPTLEDFINKETIISDFKKIYRLSDELGVDDTVFKNLKSDVGELLIQIFSNISQDKKDNTIIYSALKHLSAYLKSYKDIPQLDKLFKRLIDTIERIKEAKVVDIQANRKKFSEQLQTAQEIFNEFVETNIFDSIILLDFRDEFCKALSIKSVEYYNQTSDIDIASGFIKIAQSVGGSISTNSKLQESLETLSQIRKDQNEPIFIFPMKPNEQYPEFCFYNKKLIVTDEGFFKGKTVDCINYSEVIGYGFVIVKHSVNGIPTGVDHELNVIMSDSSRYSYSCKTSGWSFDDTKNTNFYAILSVFEKAAKQNIIDNIINLIFNKKETYSIGKITFNNVGIIKSGLFSDKQLLYKDIKYKAKVSSGFAIIFNENGREFASVSLDTINAPVIPDLINEILAVYARVRKYHE